MSPKPCKVCNPLKIRRPSGGARDMGDDYRIAGLTEDSIEILLDEAVAFGPPFLSLNCSQRSLAKGSRGGSMGGYLQNPRG